MIVFVALALTVLTFAFIIYPLFKQRSRSVDLVKDEKLQELHSNRDTTYSMLKELEFDYQSGILTEEDYRDLEAKYKRKAVATLRGIDDLAKALAQMQRVSKEKYMVVESYRSPAELFNLQCWALTCESFFSPQEWQWLFEQFGYTGDYEFIFFE